MINRRSLITGLISLVAAPAIVRAGSLMPVKAMLPLLSTFDGEDIVWRSCPAVDNNWSFVIYNDRTHRIISKSFGLLVDPGGHITVEWVNGTLTWRADQ